MKKILLLTILCFPVLFSWAQRKPEPKPVTAPAVRKPSGPSPYVLKKEYDSVSTSLRNQIKSLQGTIGSLKGSIGDKDNELSALALQMKQVEDLLNSTNFKIALTSDSLDKTRLSIEEVQRESNEGLLALNEQVKDLKTQLMLLWVLAIAGLGLAAYALMHSKKQIKSIIDRQSRNAKLYTDSKSSALHENFEAMNGFIAGLKDDLQSLSNTVQSLKDK